MKTYIYKIGFLLLAFVLVISCESPEGKNTYTPAEYELPSAISLESNSITNSSFELTYTNSGLGEGYYVVVDGGSKAPSNEDILAGVADGLVEAGNFALESNTINTITIDGLCDDSVYDVYTVQFTSDSFLSDATTELLNTSTLKNQNIAGTYNVVTNGVISGNFEGENLVDYTSVVVITDNGDGTFTFDDATAGYYADPDYYGGFGHPALPHTFEDVACNVISDEFDTGFANCCNDYITFDGKINNDGSLSVHWESAFGEIMDAVYTKQ